MNNKMTLKNFFNAGGYIDITIKRRICVCLGCPMFHHANSIDSAVEMIKDLSIITCQANVYSNTKIDAEHLFEIMTFQCNGIFYSLSSDWDGFTSYIRNYANTEKVYYLIATSKVFK